MKANIHPNYYQATVSCACGNSVVIGSTKEAIATEVCSNCHPFYTGKQKIVDSAHRVEKLQAKRQKQVTASVGRTHLSKTAKRAAKSEKSKAPVKQDAKAALKAALSDL
ncbi:MAG: 50S ribosomal protein L31 [Candidatus Kerfeldbacteria bacterium]|nr:50S ribosomal protein L31 [Candidatus Kerfeldbacteria bacterium]